MNDVQIFMMGWLMKNNIGKREQKKADLKSRLIEAAYARIEQNGLANIRAREITADAGCALGALYTAFDDIDMLILHVNSLSLKRLGDHLAEIGNQHTDPAERLIALARGYLSFACDNLNLWSAMFDHKMPEGRNVPEWHLAEHAALFTQIARPVAQLRPNIEESELINLSRSMFAAVHGIVSISLQDRFIAVPRAELNKQLTQFVGFMVTGLRDQNTT